MLWILASLLLGVIAGRYYIWSKREDQIDDFIDHAEHIIQLYDEKMRKILENVTTYKESRTEYYGNWSITFSTTAEASMAMESIIKKTIEQFESKEYMQLYDELKQLNRRLIDICAEIRMMRWRQGI